MNKEMTCTSCNTRKIKYKKCQVLFSDVQYQSSEKVINFFAKYL